MKPTLEYLQKLNKQQYNEKILETQRLHLALKLNICPNCGDKLLEQNILHRLCDYKKCSKCGNKFNFIDPSIFDLP